jgi:hypothetical protein
MLEGWMDRSIVLQSFSLKDIKKDAWMIRASLHALLFIIQHEFGLQSFALFLLSGLFLLI